MCQFHLPCHAVHPEYLLLRLSYALALVPLPSIVLQEPEGSEKINRRRRYAVKYIHHGLHPAAQFAQTARV
jgi:hypothetical protein